MKPLPKPEDITTIVLRVFLLAVFWHEKEAGALSVIKLTSWSDS